MSVSFSASSAKMVLDVTGALDQIGDVAAVCNLLVMLRESLAQDSPKIAQLLAQGDVPGANLLLHAIKGFVPIFCTSDLCDLVVEVEMLSQTSKATALQVAQAYAPLQPKFAQLQAEIAQYLLSQGVAV